jgi:hypothetical protein
MRCGKEAVTLLLDIKEYLLRSITPLNGVFLVA